MRPLRQFVFFAVLALGFGLCGALSFYKIAIANAHRLFAELPATAPPGGPTAPAVAARGHRLLQVIGCADCHGPALLGQTLLQAEQGVVLTAPSLRRGAHAGMATSTGLWRRLRLGVDDERRALWGMPRRALLSLRDEDAAAIYQVIASLPPKPAGGHAPLPQSHLTPIGYVSVARRSLWLSERDDPKTFAKLWQEPAPAPGAASFGPYLAALAHCTSCHQAPTEGRQMSVYAGRTGPALQAMLSPHRPLAEWAASWQTSRCQTVQVDLNATRPALLLRADLFAASEQAALRAALLAQTEAEAAHASAAGR